MNFFHIDSDLNDGVFLNLEDISYISFNSVQEDGFTPIFILFKNGIEKQFLLTEKGVGKFFLRLQVRK